MGLLRDIVGGGLGGGIIGAIQRRRKKRESAGAGASSGGATDTDDPGAPGQFKRGGKVRRTGMARVHAGEQVLTKSQARKYRSRKR